MATYRVWASRVIEAPPAEVYRVIRDMAEHRKILPREFESVEVLEGGIGAGTVVRVQMNAMGARASYLLTILEPEPGRVLQEVDRSTGLETTWTFTPAAGGEACDLRIESVIRRRPGFAGLLERLINPLVIRSIYRRELELLNAYVKRHRT